MELAVLKGSEKQVKWAQAIRKDRLKVWQGSDSAGYQDAESLLIRQEMASWWITSRDMSLGEVCSQLRGGAKPKAPGRTAPPARAQAVRARQPEEEVWETVATASGFRRSGPARDLTTGAVMVDATLPF